MCTVIEKILCECTRQDAKWGEQNWDDYHWLAILAEEFGELAQAVLHNEFGGSAAGNGPTELVQVAAVAVTWLECLKRRGLKLPAEKAGVSTLFIDNE